MKFTLVLLLVSLVTTFTTSAEGRWVRDRGTTVEVVVVQKAPSTPPPVIVIATNATTTIPVVVSTNAVNAAAQPTSVVVYQQTNWPAKVSTTGGFEKPTEYKATVAQVQEPRRKKGFFGRFFGPCPPTIIDAASGDKLPANPVRRSEGSFTLPTMWGTYNSSYSRGTDTYAESSWDENGPRRVFRQTIHDNGSTSFYPEGRRWIAPTYYQQYQGPQGTVTWP